MRKKASDFLLSVFALPYNAAVSGSQKWIPSPRTGFLKSGGNDALADEYAGRHWACYQCRVPDYEMVQDTFNGPQRLSLRCSVNRYAPFAGSSACESFDPDPQLLELR